MSDESSLEPGLHIEIINPDIVYELNDLINGVLTIELNKRLLSKLIILKLKCVGEVQWLLPSLDTHLNTHFLKESEKFLDTNYSVEKSRYVQVFGLMTDRYFIISDYKSICEAGLHKIPFQFQLTDRKLPPSFKEENNFICYYITASIVDEKTNQLLIKTAPVYINKVQIGSVRSDLALSIGSSACRNVPRNFCFQKKDKVQVWCFISKKGYVTGECVPVDLHIINNSTHKVSSHVTLYQTKCFFCKNRQHIVEHHFEEMNGSTVLRGRDIKETINLRIPDNCIVSFKTSIIQVSYFIHLSINITKSTDIHLNLPIILTTKKSMDEIG